LFGELRVRRWTSAPCSCSAGVLNISFFFILSPAYWGANLIGVSCFTLPFPVCGLAFAAAVRILWIPTPFVQAGSVNQFDPAAPMSEAHTFQDENSVPFGPDPVQCYVTSISGMGRLTMVSSHTHTPVFTERITFPKQRLVPRLSGSSVHRSVLLLTYDHFRGFLALE